jgi:hypothetical protein
MKYVSTVLFLSVSFLTLSSSAFAQGRCNGVVDVVTGLACVGQKTGEVAVDLKDKAAPPIGHAIREGKIIVRANGDVLIEEKDQVADHLHADAHELGQVWKKDFKNMDDEKDQDVAHATGDLGRALGETSKKVGTGFWHGLKSIAGASDKESVRIINAEETGFKGREPVDVVTASVDLYKGTEKAFIVAYGDGRKYLVKRVGDKFSDAVRLEDSKQDLKDMIAKGKEATDQLSLNNSTPNLPMLAADRQEAKPMEAQTSASEVHSSNVNRSTAGTFDDHPIVTYPQQLDIQY